jgi:FkbM family methyltransferase
MKCAVITPIGPGHEQLYLASCLTSIQTAIEYSLGPFKEVIPIGMDDGEGKFGRSERRNTAVKLAKIQGIDWVFFLDADDTLTPNAFDAFGRCITQSPELDVIWGLICEGGPENDPTLRDPQAPEISNYNEFLLSPPWQAVQIGCFVRIECAIATPFDENLDAGEDYKFYIALWKGYRCRKFHEIFFVNFRGHHSTGSRSATGNDWRAAVEKLWFDEISINPVWTDIEFEEISARVKITNPLDIIQVSHLAGKFFDEDGLRGVRKYANPGCRVIDVGANIGNHTLWFCKALNASMVFPVEPNPAALKVLKANLNQNQLETQIDKRGLGIGLGKCESWFKMETADKNNLGATQLVSDRDGEVRVVSLDELMEGETADFLKIDAEGMEMDVLFGARRFIKKSRPIIWIEVLRRNQLDFAQTWCRDNRYSLRDSWFYVHTVDYLAVPQERQ